EYRLHPVGPVVTGFRVVYPFSRAAEVLRAYRDFTASIPDELTLNAALLHAPDGSGVKLAGIVGCHVGPAEQAERDLAPLLALGSAEDVLAGPIEYTTLNSLLDAAYPRGALNYWKSSFLDSFSDEAIAVMVDEFAACPSPSSAFVIENPHGEATSVPVEATAVPFRAPGYNFLITSVWRDAAASEANVAWTRRAFEAVRPFAADRCYVNYLAGDEAAAGRPPASLRHLVADDGGSLHERLQLHLRDHPRQRLHAAVGGERDPVRRDVLEHLADAAGDLLRRLDHHRADVEDADGDLLVLRQVGEEIDAVHVAVGVVEHELVDSGRVPEVRQHRLVALREVGAEDVVAPGVAEAEVPADLRIDALAAAPDDVLDPVVVGLVAGEQG